MAELTMNEIIHAAVRRDLARMEAALGTFPDGDAARAGALQRAWLSLSEMLHHHHQGEDDHVWPYLRSLGVVEPALVEAMEAEHAAMAASMHQATAAVADLVASPTSEQAARTAAMVAQAREVTCRHLDHEERDVMPIIVPRMDTPEWKAVGKQLSKGSPILAGRLFAWLQDGIEPELAAALRSEVPGPLLLVFSRVLGRSYHRDVAPVWR